MPPVKGTCVTYALHSQIRGMMVRLPEKSHMAIFGYRLPHLVVKGRCTTYSRYTPSLRCDRRLSINGLSAFASAGWNTLC
jgi:hypothetical protein